MLCSNRPEDFVSYALLNTTPISDELGSNLENLQPHPVILFSRYHPGPLVHMALPVRSRHACAYTHCFRKTSSSKR